MQKTKIKLIAICVPLVAGITFYIFGAINNYKNTVDSSSRVLFISRIIDGEFDEGSKLQMKLMIWSELNLREELKNEWLFSPFHKKGNEKIRGVPSAIVKINLFLDGWPHQMK